MPLHLLGKKSWNVYNADNIARVQADKAAAAAAEEAAEQRMQDVDATRRLAVLRGETPPPLPSPEPEIRTDRPIRDREDRGAGSERRKRKRVGEDDTDFEMRLARERAEVGSRVTTELAKASPAAGQMAKLKERDIVDRRGHIDLFGNPDASKKPSTEKNAEFEREAAKKKREMEDQYTMRFSNAAGRDGFSAGAPWYAKADSKGDVGAGPAKADLAAEMGMEASTKDAWGREDPKRKDRELTRLDANDPLAMMKRGARQVREVKKERNKYTEERERELEEGKREERRREKRRRRDRRHGDDNGIASRPDRPERSERRHDDRKREEHLRKHRDDDDRRKDSHRDRSSRPDRSEDGRHSHHRSHDRDR